MVNQSKKVLGGRAQVIFFVAFTVLGFLALQIPLTRLVGSDARFTVFDAFGPIAGGFLGGIVGAVSVLLMQVANFVAHGAQAPDAGTFIRLLPMVFAAVYFGKRTTLNVIVPLLAMVAFVVHPVGRTVWFFSLFWLIPIFCSFIQERSLIARSLGATFTAHAVGGALWVYFVPLPAAAWVALIPIVMVERLTFTAGISLTYLVFNNVFQWLNERLLTRYKLPVQPEYVWHWGRRAAATNG